jgi:DNA replication protein DnaC
MRNGRCSAAQPRITILPASNTPFSDWGDVLYTTTTAAAIADRLVENSEIFLLGGESLRKAQKGSPPPAS